MHPIKPDWLNAIAGAHDRAIIGHAHAAVLSVDADDVRLPSHQQWIESPVGSIWIDSQQRKIIGYGPAVETPRALAARLGRH